MQISPAVTVALTHIDAWSRHDWDKTKELLAPDVHAWVTNTQADFARTVEFTGVEEYMARKVKGAQLVEPGSVQVVSTFGDESNALILVTFRIGLGPSGTMVTMARACLYSLDENKKIKEERDEFLVLQHWMNAMNESRFVYVIFIATTPAKLWEALTDSERVRKYWFGATIDCSWKKGSSWKMLFPDGRTADVGDILEIDRPRHMVIRWQNEWKPEFKAEGPSRCTIELEPVDRAVKLTITHAIDRPDSEFIKALSAAWPVTMSNLKSLLETDEVAVTTHPGH